MTTDKDRTYTPTPGPGMSYPWRDAPGEAQLFEVAPGVNWLRMPLPFVLDHINLWLLQDAEGWTLVDTGLASEKVKVIWTTLLVQLDQPIRRILATHFHPDHLGLAGWLQERCNALLLASASEWLLGSLLYYDIDGRHSSRMLEFFAAHGLDAKWLQKLDTGNRYRQLVSPPPTYYQRLREGDTVTIGDHQWRVMVGLGHSPEHICLYCARLDVLISGDQILPRITPNISVYGSEPDANPLQDYLDSLKQFSLLPEGTLVLPAHGFPFRGIEPRIRYIEEHHDDRFDELLQALDRPRQAADLIPVLFSRELDPHQMMFAMGETLAHLSCLQGRGLLERRSNRHGQYLYSRP